MRTHRQRRGIRVLIPIVCVVALLAVGGAAASAAAGGSSSSLAGTWKGTYSGAFSGTFTIIWKESRSRLSGSITLSSPHGTYSIGGSVHRGAIKFGAVSVGAKYTGSVSGASMSGTWASPQGGGSWSAHKIVRVTKR